MPKLRVSSLGNGSPLLDIASHARPGLGRRDHLSPADIASITRTVRRVPEVVVKVLPRNPSSLRAVGRHINYIGRYGELELETDDGDRISGRMIGHSLAEDWDLDLDEYRRHAHLAASLGREPPKLVHKLVFSMPAGTSPEGVLAAARDFLRQEFALQHRYAFVLHVDQPQPHVHAVIKAVSEQGVRLHIRKATLREWRQQFARHLREHGIAANATERAVRGDSRTHKMDGIYRASLRGASTHMRARTEQVAAELATGRIRAEPQASKLRQTRKHVETGWEASARLLERDGHIRLAQEVRAFKNQMPPPRTDKEWLAHDLIERVRNSQHRRPLPMR